jgi:hypothetical protein
MQRVQSVEAWRRITVRQSASARAAPSSGVMDRFVLSTSSCGLDPRIHHLRKTLSKKMDCRVSRQ